MVFQWANTNGFTCRKHNGESVIDYVLFSEAIMHNIQSFTLGDWNPKPDHRMLCIDMISKNTPKYAHFNHDVVSSYLCMDFKKAPMYASMVGQMTWKALRELDHNEPLEVQWESFKNVICSCAKECFAIKHGSYKHAHKRSPRKK